ncbi:MAG: bacillithiol system redox-active protein YtxJ [Flavobacteriia bacterium]|nr:bacillithiol system redox-active protein YtxJ [Flavobacteriia bacterium]
MHWIELTTLGQLDRIDDLSRQKPVLIFKHSTTCRISKGALARLEKDWTAADDAGHPAYYLDLWAHRDISDAVETRYGIRHESPQVLVIRNGACIHHTSHRAITYTDTVEAMVEPA